MIEERLEEEIQKLLEEMSEERFDSEKYQKMSSRLQELQATLNQESERLYLAKRAESEIQKSDSDYQKMELERAALDIEMEKLKQTRRGHFWDLVKEGVKGVIFVGANVAVGALLIMANNSGESLPPFANKVLNGWKFK